MITSSVAAACFDRGRLRRREAVQSEFPDDFSKIPHYLVYWRVG